MKLYLTDFPVRLLDIMKWLLIILKSIRFQVLSVVTVIMIITGYAIMKIADTYIEEISEKESKGKKELCANRCKAIEHAMDFIDLVLVDNFNYLLRSRSRLVDKKKKVLKSNIDFIELNNYSFASIMQTLAEKNKNIDNEYINFMFINRDGEILLPKDMKNRNLRVNIRRISNDDPFFSKFEIVDNNFNIEKDTKSIGYFYNYSEDLILLSYSNLSSIEKEDYDKIIEVKKDLNKILEGLKIERGEGFSFIFDKKQDKIVRPITEHSKCADIAMKLFFEEKRCNGFDEKCNYKDTKLYELNSYNINTKSFKCCIEKTNDNSDEKYKDIEEYELLVNKLGCRYNSYNMNTKPFKGYSMRTKIFKGFDWYYSVLMPIPSDEEPPRELTRYLMIAILIISIFSIFILWIIVSKFLSPIATLSKKMSKAHNHDFTLDDHSELLDGLPVEAYNETGQLAEVFSFMIKKISENIKNLVAATTIKERMQSELNIARNIQLDAVPKDFSCPRDKFIDIHAYLKPAREIGGDLYDFFFIDDDHLCFTVGDVADKGVPSALFMFCAKKVINGYAVKMGDLSPAQIMNVLNDVICQDNTSFTFITLFIGILNIRTGELRYANGGHVPPIFADCDSTPEYKKDKSGPAVGIDPEIRYKDIAAVIRPGGAVFICTDGITEAMNEEEKPFGNKRLLDNFSCMKDKSCEEVVEGILHEVRNYAGTAPQSDDIAVLMIRRASETENKINN